MFERCKYKVMGDFETHCKIDGMKPLLCVGQEDCMWYKNNYGLVIKNAQ